MSRFNNHNYNKESLAKGYQSEIMDNKNRKFNDKLQTLQQERIEMQKLQLELDNEKLRKIQSKNDIVNSQRLDYQNYLNSKGNMREKVVQIGKKNNELQGTYKIGAENREIRRKNYDDISDRMNLNVTRKENYNQNYDYNLGNNNTQIAMNQNRGKSQGYNIINHENFGKNKLNTNPNLPNVNSNSYMHQQNSPYDNSNGYNPTMTAMNNYNTYNNPNPVASNSNSNPIDNNNNDALNKYSDYDLQKYGFGNNYETKNDMNNPNANVNMNVNKTLEDANNPMPYDANNTYEAEKPAVNDYSKMYEEYMKNQMASNSNNPQSAEITSVDISNNNNPYEKPYDPTGYLDVIKYFKFLNF